MINIENVNYYIYTKDLEDFDIISFLSTKKFEEMVLAYNRHGKFIFPKFCKITEREERLNYFFNICNNIMVNNPIRHCDDGFELYDGFENFSDFFKKNFSPKDTGIIFDSSENIINFISNINFLLKEEIINIKDLTSLSISTENLEFSNLILNLYFK